MLAFSIYSFSPDQFLLFFPSPSTIPSAKRLDLESPIVLLKACKNSAELEGMRACHLRDAAALVEFLAWLDEHYEQVKTDNGAVTGGYA